MKIGKHSGATPLHKRLQAWRKQCGHEIVLLYATEARPHAGFAEALIHRGGGDFEGLGARVWRLGALRTSGMESRMLTQAGCVEGGPHGSAQAPWSLLVTTHHNAAPSTPPCAHELTVHTLGHAQSSRAARWRGWTASCAAAVGSVTPSGLWAT